MDEWRENESKKWTKYVIQILRDVLFEVNYWPSNMNGNVLW